MIHFVYKDKEDLDKILEYEKARPDLAFHILSVIKDKTKAYQLKARWGARKDPFILIEENGKVIKAFYSEVDDNVIESLMNYVNLS